MYSAEYNHDSHYVIEQSINQKNSYQPFWPNGKQIKLTLTDMDHFPYRRFFRGVYNEPIPIIHSRYAGYRPYMDIGCGIKCKTCPVNKK